MTVNNVLSMLKMNQESRNELSETIQTQPLPFVKKNENSIHFWNVKPSGDYVKDCETGRSYARVAFEHMKRTDFIALFTWCVMDMPAREHCSGIEVGFLEYFAERATAREF